MKAAVMTGIGTFETREVPRPTLTGEDALIKVKYCGICGTEGHMYTGHFHKLNFPIIPGHEYVGVLEEIRSDNPECQGFQKGDWVVAQPFFSCESCMICAEGGQHYCKNIAVTGTYIDGGYAEHVRVPAKKLIKINPQEDMKVMALTEPFAIGVHNVLTGEVKLGDTVFIIGAGVIAMMLALAARMAGARQVVLCDINEYKLSFAREQGFAALDSRAPDFLDRAKGMTDGALGYDHVFEASGSEFGVRVMTDLAIPGGIVVQTGVANAYLPVDIASFTIKHIQIRGTRLHTFKDYVRAARLLEAGSERAAFSRMVTQVFPIEQAAQAMEAQLNTQEHMKILIENTEF